MTTPRIVTREDLRELNAKREKKVRERKERLENELKELNAKRDAKREKDNERLDRNRKSSLSRDDMLAGEDWQQQQELDDHEERITALEKRPKPTPPDPPEPPTRYAPVVEPNPVRNRNTQNLDRGLIACGVIAGIGLIAVLVVLAFMAFDGTPVNAVASATSSSSSSQSAQPTQTTGQSYGKGGYCGTSNYAHSSMVRIGPAQANHTNPVSIGPTASGQIKLCTKAPAYVDLKLVNGGDWTPANDFENPESWLPVVVACRNAECPTDTIVQAYWN